MGHREIERTQTFELFIDEFSKKNKAVNWSDIASPLNRSCS